MAAKSRSRSWCLILAPASIFGVNFVFFGQEHLPKCMKACAPIQTAARRRLRAATEGQNRQAVGRRSARRTGRRRAGTAAAGRPTGAAQQRLRLSGQEALALGALAGKLTGAADGFRLLPRLLFG